MGNLMLSNTLFKRMAHFSGNLLAIAGCVFVVLRLNEYHSQLDLSRFTVVHWVIILALALTYGLGNAFLAMSWRNLLQYFGVTTAPLVTIRIYGLTLLAKYIPGNIMHLVGRQAMGISVGIGGKALVKASLWEIGLIAITGLLFAILVLPQLFDTVTISMAMLGFVTIVFLVIGTLKHYASPIVVKAFLGHLAFLITSCTIFICLLILSTDAGTLDASNYLLVGAAFVVAWVIGLLTPGAPAGIGIRELILVFLLTGLVGESNLLVAVLLSRIVTVVGDIVFFMYASRIHAFESSSVT